MSLELVWPFLLVGLAAGGLYALLGCGTVLAYRASGYLHIAHAGVAMVSALVYVVLVDHLPVGVAALLAVALGAVATWALYRVVFARLERSSMPAKVVVSVATGIGLQAVGGALLVNFGLLDGNRGSVSLFPESVRLEAFGASINAQQAALPVAALLAVVGLQWALHHTDLGLALRAAAQNPVSAELAGLPAQRVTASAWALTGVLAGLAGVLAVSSAAFLVPTFLFAETIRALAASLAGGFVDLRRMAAAGFALGVVESELVGFSPPWNEMRGATSFALITAIAIFGLGRQLGDAERAEARAA